MKQTLKRRICAAILCHILLLGLAGCGKANKAKPNDGGDPPVKASVDALKQGQPAADSEETVDGAESFARVRGDLEYDGRLTGAAAYLGLREKGDQTELTDWLRENCADLTSELPFLLEIPSERVLGAGYGKLFCIVPRDENTSLAVNHVTWQMMGNGLHPVADEVLYREEYAEPVLVFVDPEEPDKEVNLVTNDGVAAIWYPQEDGYGNLFLPTDEAGAPMLYDFAIYGYTTGLDYPEGWEPSGDDWWLPPTELGLADTSWLCDSWVLELRGGSAVLCGALPGGEAGEDAREELTGFLRFLHADTLRTEHPLTLPGWQPAAPLTLWELPKGCALPLPPAPPAELVPDKAPSMLPVSRLVFAESDAEADEFYSAACTALAHGVGTCRALLHNGRPVCTVGCYEQSDTESYMAAGVTDPAWQGRGLARYLIVGLANELTAERAVRFACFPALCGFYAQLGFLQIGKIQHYTTDWNTT